jgi:leucyl aminopeptidase
MEDMKGDMSGGAVVEAWAQSPSSASARVLAVVAS